MEIKSLYKDICRKVLVRFLIILTVLILAYLLIALYFNSHFLIGTVINGVNVSLKAYKDVDAIMEEHVNGFILTVTESDGKREEIKGQEIGLKYRKNNNIPQIYKLQKSLHWGKSIFQHRHYVTDSVFAFDNNALINRINRLSCLNRKVTEPQNVSYEYSDGIYVLVKEVHGNRINRNKLVKEIVNCIKTGKSNLDLKESDCYDKPEYTMESEKARRTLKVLNKYVSSKITYLLGKEQETLDGDTFHHWIRVDESLNVLIDKTAVSRYVKTLGKKYNTVGIARKFKTSVGKTIEVKGGLYGWKINESEETAQLIKDIGKGSVTVREPVYKQRALYRGDNEIGNTYVEINITRQHLWFYKDGKLIAHGPVVTGNPNKGNATVVGTNMLNYKQEGAVLSGSGYEVKVKYWMPFYGNIGLHDASWRHAFGGNIYKNRGTHGCVNGPLYLVKKIYENIEEGIPFISYEE